MKYLSNTLLKSSEQPWEEVGKGIRRKITGFNDHLMMVLVQFDAGGVGEPHRHVHSQSSYVESGSFEVTIDGNTALLEKGDCFFVPPHTVHGAVCKSAGILVDVFSPVREDFL